MVQYRRSFAPGGTFFFTVALRNRRSCLLVEKFHLLKEAVNQVKRHQPFHIKAYVILPEHLHMIWELPHGDTDYSLRWKKIKALFSKSIQKSGIKLNKTKHNEYLLWQRRFWEHTIKDEIDFENHVNYIHYNPIKHGLVNDLQNWPYSSFHHYMRDSQPYKDWTKEKLIRLNSFSFGE